MAPINIGLFACIAVLGLFALNITAGGLENVPHYLGVFFGV